MSRPYFHMKSLNYLILFVISLAFAACGQDPSTEEISEQLSLMSGDANRDSLYNKVYSVTDFQPIWVKAQGLNSQGEDFLTYLEEVKYDGLDKTDYLYDEIESLVDELSTSDDPELHAVLDMMLSNSFLKLSHDLDLGKVDPTKLNMEWKIESEPVGEDYHALLVDISKNNASVSNTLDKLRPDNFRYEQLRAMLKRAMEEEEEEIIVLSFDGKVEQGESHEKIPAIRRKLIHTGDLKSYTPTDSTIYDDRLAEGVRLFQRRHGLNDDGVLGQDFIEAINYSNQDLITKLKVNLERFRWLPNFTEGEGDKVIVNIPDFFLDYISGNDTIFRSRVVVGKEYRQTPVFSSKMSYLVFSPTWTLPNTILWEDAIPAIQRDRGYLEKNKMQVINNQGEPVDASRIDWKNADKGNFPYMIRQSPGAHNSLGRVKFMFPNDYSIYIHDSPAKALFDKDERTFSSGCIRLEKPQEFASLLLKDSGWDDTEIVQAMDMKSEKNVNLERNPEVWILYLTIWENKDGIQVREDVYSGDRTLAKALSLPVSNYFL
jgi:L,D-transpeptidase YcbB